MISCWHRGRTVRFVALACTASVIGSLLSTGVVQAGERQFIVILANSPKQFPGVGHLANPNLVDRQYFDTVDPSVGSFAEYWREISYGDVTIRGKTTDWVNLPWRVIMDPAVDSPDPDVPNVVNLNGDNFYFYGMPERFDTYRAMVIVDLDGDPNGIDNGPYTSIQNPPYARGGRDTNAVTGAPVWMPGERFVDMDGDGRWDGVNEATNLMDLDGDDQPDLDGPWYDLDRNGEPENTTNCVYLPDSDNDGNPDCCPNGPSDAPPGGLLPEAGCRGYPADSDAACPGTFWNGPGDVRFDDCNGNMIPDACDVSCSSTDCQATGWVDENPSKCGGSTDELPKSAGDNLCDVDSPNGIPDECEFESADTDCTTTAPSGDPLDPQPCDDTPQCVELFFSRLPNDLPQRCEYHDSNGSRTLDLVEPFENFITVWRVPGGWGPADDEYIRNNYPGDPEKVIDRSGSRGSRTLMGQHDPFGKLTGGVQCICANGELCGSDTMCPAGDHAQYDPPDWWLEVGSTKMQQNYERAPEVVPSFLDLVTPQPVWYEQAWRDRYGTDPPPWNLGRLPEIVPFREDERRCFAASDGGVGHNGIGWVGCSDRFDPGIEFYTGSECGGEDADNQFAQACNNRILPEERNGIGGTLILFDGPVEHDDLPSSKYHKGGDERLGEVTSPFNNDIWGHDRGRHSPTQVGTPDHIIPAAGPYAINVHGNFGRDAGNVMSMELLTWRTEPPFNNGRAWLTDLRFDGNRLPRLHLYAEEFGFRDYNLDGLVDQGEVRQAGSENYLVDPFTLTPDDGVDSAYPWNRNRLMEDVIAILDDVIDFDDFVDPVALAAVECTRGTPSFPVPEALQRGNAPDRVMPTGILSGIVLLPPGAHPDGPFDRAPGFLPIHNEDGLNDATAQARNLPPTAPGAPAQVSWRLFFHNLVFALETGGDFLTSFAASEYLNSWEAFPDLYDYDVYDAGAIENCPIGEWGIMADGGLVHPVPALKDLTCTDWTRPVDLTTILTPGVDKALTLPPVESVRDNSYFFLENPNRPGERYWLWSAGQRFDERMPGSGMLMLHTDVPLCDTSSDCPDDGFCLSGICRASGSNPEAMPGQRSADRPAYLIVQADGNNDLQVCSTGGNRGDDGDPWPGSTGATQFNADGTTRTVGIPTNTPSSTWYALGSPTGLEVVDVQPPDASGAVRVRLNWVPTTIPSLRFRQPPGGVSVAGSPYQVRFDATDVYGGTTIRMFYMKDQKTCSGSGADCTDNGDCPSGERCRYDTTIGPDAERLVGWLKKTTSGTSALSIPWNIQGVTDGRYVLFAKLNPGPGADGSEKKNTEPQANRNNVGTGFLRVDAVSINDNAFDNDDHARLETWMVTCIDNGQTWRVNSTLSQPVVNEDDPDTDPYPKATTRVMYTSAGGEVMFTVGLGAVPYERGDTFTFTTTGITAVSRAVTITAGRISEDPIALIHALPLSGPPPLTVEFDGRDSVDPTSANLDFFWDFGDGDLGAGATSQHVFDQPGTFSVVLTVVNPNNQRFGQATVDILVTNNSPKAVISALPTSGVAPLQVSFNAAASSDAETPSDRIIYLWDYGDGATANNQLWPGLDFQSVQHTYRTDADGSACTHASPCEFLATLTVIDELGSEGTDSVEIVVGNSKPFPHVSVRPTEGPAPLPVEFNAINSTDPDGDPLTVDWDFGDGETELNLPITGQDGTTGRVLHTYLAQGEFFPTAVFKDGHGGVTTWPEAAGAVTIKVTGNEAPSAAFMVTPAVGEAGVPIEFDAGGSIDVDGVIEAYDWDFGDGNTETTTIPVITHTYEDANLGGYVVRLTVRDNIGAESSTSRTIVVGPARGNLPPIAHIATGSRNGVVPLSLTLDGRTSFDPDNDPLVYSWSLEHDGTTLVITTDGHRNWNAAEGNPSGGVLYTCSEDEGDVRICAASWGTDLPDMIAAGEENVSLSRSATANGATLPMVFRTPGLYSISMTVDDGRENGAVTTLPETIIVTEAGAAPPDDDEPGQDVPDGDNGDQDSADQRPGVGMCGVGMLMSLFGSLLGLTAMRATHRRQRP